MGSSGSGTISDYPGSSSSTVGGSGSASDKGAEDRCSRAFNVRLEDAEQGEYYRAYRVSQPLQTQLRVVQRKRLVAETMGGESIGNLPTSLNYLASCIKAGWTYIGVVQSVINGPPVVIISVDFAATAPA